MELVRRLRAGDKVTFEAFFRELLPGVRRMAMRYFHSPFDQEEAVQEALLALYRQREHLDPLRADASRGWAFTVARRKMIDLLRAAKKPTEALDDQLESESFADDAPSPSEAAQHQQLHALVLAFETKLKPSYRAFFHAVFVEGRDFDEAREVLGLGRLRARYLKKVLVTRLRGHAPLLAALGAGAG